MQPATGTPAAAATPQPVTSDGSPTGSESPAIPPREKFEVADTSTGQELVPGEDAVEMTLGDAEAFRAFDEGDRRKLGGSRSGLVRWRVTVDPTSPDDAIPVDARLRIKIPGLTPATRDNFWEGERLRILYPDVPSPFVGLGLNEGPNDVREVWDLRTNKSIGEIKGLGLGRSKLLALSPDGKYFAAKPQFADIVGIYDVDAEKPIRTFPLEKPFTRLVAFAGPNRLIFDDDDVLQVWSVPQLEQLYTLELPAWLEAGACSISPGGRYFVAVDRAGFQSQATFFDMDDGSQAGVLTLSDKANCQGTAFSHDGTQFAALLEGTWGGGALQVWDVATGTIVAEHELEEPLKKQIAPHDQYQGRNLEWFPDGSFLLVYGRGVYDVDAGQLLSTLPASTAYEIKVLDATRIAVVQKDQLVPYDLKDQFERAVQARAAGGTADDANRPPLTRADRTSVKEMAVPANALPWSVRAARAPTNFAKATSRPIEIPGGQVFFACLATGESPLAAVMYSREPLRPYADHGPSNAKNAVWVERFDLRTGSKRRSLPLPFPTALMDISPSARLFVTQLADGMNRLDVWSGQDGKHRFGFRPYQERGNSAGRAVEYAEFIDDSHLVTVAGERLVVWEVPAGRALYEMTIGQTRPRFTAARDFLFVTDPDQRMLVCLEALTGEAAGTLPLGKLPAETVNACRISPDGRTLAVITRRPSGGELNLIDMLTGTSTTTFPLPVTAEVIQWVDDGYLLLDGTRLVSLSQQAVVWTYELPMGMHLRESADQRHWYMAADSPFDKTFKLLAVNLPETQVAEHVSSPIYRSQVLLQPGGRISLSVNVGGVPGEPAFGDKVTRALTEKLAAAEISVVPGQPLKLIVNGSSGSSGKTLTNDMLGTGRGIGGGAVVKIPEQHVTWTISIEHEGKPVWETEIITSNAGSYSYNRDWEQDQVQSAAVQQTTDRMWNAAARRLLEFEPPKYAFPAGASWGAGKSRLTTRGPIPQ